MTVMEKFNDVERHVIGSEEWRVKVNGSGICCGFGDMSGDMAIFPMTVKIDSFGAIYLANNQPVNGKTRHVNIYYNFVRQLIKDEAVKVEFVCCKENKADEWTKNFDANLFHKHWDSYVTDFPSK